ncbi:hypothetical protein BDR26DRAFT_934025 [Obelidium mucronatum]|nr:hypothetical protein BDR26DRAFT_934025 [Obelidium mucronatum]
MESVIADHNKVQQRELDIHILNAIEKYMSSNDQRDLHDGLLIELTDESSPLFIPEDNSTPSAHILMSYPGALFAESAYSVLPTQKSDDVKLVEVISFKQFEGVAALSSSAKNPVDIRQMRIPCKDTHSTKLAEAFGLQFIDANELALESLYGDEEDSDVLTLLQETISQSTNTRGILIGGYAKNVKDASTFEEVIGPISAVLKFQVPSAIPEKRSISAIKQRLFGTKEAGGPKIQDPIERYFGKRVISIETSNDESEYHDAWSKLLAAGLFTRDQNIVLSIGNATHPAEANLLSTQLALDHNLALVRLGSAKNQSEALISKCLELLSASKPAAAAATPRFPNEDGSISGRNSILSMYGDSHEIDDIRAQLAEIQKENQILTRESKFLKRSLLESAETRETEVNLLIAENKRLQNQLDEAGERHQQLEVEHSQLQAAHQDLQQSSVEDEIALQAELSSTNANCEALLAKNAGLEADLVLTRTLHSDLTANHALLNQNHNELLNRHDIAEKQVITRSAAYESEITSLKEQLEAVKTTCEGTLQTLSETQLEAQRMKQRAEEMESVVIQMNLQMVGSSEKLKKSRAKELEREIERLTQALSQQYAETQFLKSLMKTSGSKTPDSVARSTPTPKRGWAFI